jgi:peptidoglycan glycosyltransferase
VNQPIIRLFGLVVVLFAVLVAFTSRWAVFDSKSLNENALNSAVSSRPRRSTAA